MPLGQSFYIVKQFDSAFFGVMPKPLPSEWEDQVYAELSEQGVNTVVSLLESGEAYSLGLSDEEVLCRAQGMSFLQFSIPDRGVPESPVAFYRFIKELYQSIAAGNNIMIHCRAGIGRSGLAAASLLVHAGDSVEQAFAKVSAARGVEVPDTEEQYEWLMAHQRPMLEA